MTLARSFPTSVTATLALFGASCATPDRSATNEPQDPAPLSAVRPALADRASELLEGGDWIAAHAALTELVTDEYLRSARAALGDGRPEDALLALDEARELAPERTDVELAFADTAYAMAEKKPDPLWLEDSLAAYERVGDSRRAQLGAGRAAFMLFRFDEALDHAARACALEPESDEALPEPPLALFARAGTFAQAEARNAGDVEKADAIVERVAVELGEALANDPLDPWAPTAISRLYESAGQLDLAQANVQSALDRMPTDAGLYQRLAEVAYAAGDDFATATTTFERVTETHPEAALGHWYLARARFDAALAEFERDPNAEAEEGSEEAVDAAAEAALVDGEVASDAPEATKDYAPIIATFRAAEQAFERCAELDPETAEAAAGWRALCRNGVAWCRFNSGDLQGAVDSFLSTNEVLEDGIEWQLAGRLLDGISGLEFVVGGFNEAGDFAAAAETSERLRELEPDEVKWANNAGFFHRDAGTGFEDQARRFKSAVAHLRGETLAVDPTDPQAIGRPTIVWDEASIAELRTEVGFQKAPRLDVEVSAYRTLASQLDARAKEHFEKSYAAYLVAAELSPEDVRIVNDTALVAIYHLGTDLDRAEAMLLRCVAMGGVQTAGQETPTLEDDHFDLWNAWGDAHQNLGVLEMRYRDRPEVAIPWFEKSVAIGPLIRPACPILIRRCQERASTSPTPR